MILTTLSLSGPKCVAALGTVLVLIGAVVVWADYEPSKEKKNNKKQ